MSVDDVEKIAGRFKPPEWNPSARLKFDLSVIALLGVIVLVGGWHIAQACGFLAWMGLPGFALASDVTAQQSQLTAIQQSQKQSEIDRDQRQICSAKVANNQSAMTAWTISLQHDITAYWQIPQIKQQPQVRSCDELMITSNG